jgi:hypothetical protein
MIIRIFGKVEYFFDRGLTAGGGQPSADNGDLPVVGRPVSAGVDRIAALVAANQRMKAEPGKFMSLGRDASSSARRMLEIRLVFCTLILHAESAHDQE